MVRVREWVSGVLDEFGGASAMDFVDNVKVDLFPDEVYVFTPRGEIRQLQRGATPVDFAYAVHSELGDRCVAARLDGQLEPLNTRSEEHTSELQSLMRISYAVFCLKKKQ